MHIKLFTELKKYICLFMNIKTEFVSSGGYGDVFCPPIPCVGNSSINVSKYLNTKYVGKLFEDQQEGESEYKDGLEIKKFDPKALFTISPVSACELNISSLRASDFRTLFRKANYYKNKKPDFDKRNRRGTYRYQIIYPFGGDSFYETIQILNQLTFNEFLFPVLFFVKNIAEMNEKGYFHFDIKEQNILFNIEKGLLYLIDFGFLSKSSKKSIERKLDTGIFYFVDSPEINLIAQSHTGLQTYKLSKYLRDNYLNSIEYLKPIIGSANNYLEIFDDTLMQLGIYTDESIPIFFDLTFIRLIQKILNSRETSSEQAEKLAAQVFDKFLNKQDAWSLGFVLFNWIIVYKKSNSNLSDIQLIILNEILLYISSDLIQVNVDGDRKSVSFFYNKTLDFIKTSFNEIYKEYMSFSDFIYKNNSSPDRDIIANKIIRTPSLNKFGKSPIANRFSQKMVELKSRKRLFETNISGTNDATTSNQQQQPQQTKSRIETISSITPFVSQQENTDATTTKTNIFGKGLQVFNYENQSDWVRPIQEKKRGRPKKPSRIDYNINNNFPPVKIRRPLKKSGLSLLEAVVSSKNKQINESGRHISYSPLRNMTTRRRSPRPTLDSNKSKRRTNPEANERVEIFELTERSPSRVSPRQKRKYQKRKPSQYEMETFSIKTPKKSIEKKSKWTTYTEKNMLSSKKKKEKKLIKPSKITSPCKQKSKSQCMSLSESCYWRKATPKIKAHCRKYKKKKS
jgi:hypothetical protein